MKYITPFLPIAFLALSSVLHAGPGDYIIQPLDGRSVTANEIEIRLATFGGGGNPVTFVDRIDMPYLDFNIVIAQFPPTIPPAVFAAANPDLIVEQDRQDLTPTGVTPSWSINSGSTGSMFPNTSAYPALAAVPSMVSRPEIYVVDSGIQSTLGVLPHPLFDLSRVSFGPGILANSLKPLLLNPYQDPIIPDGHGTAVASAAAGVCGTTPIGSLMKWPNTRCTLISARIYGPPSSGPPAAWVSDAISAISQSANWHLRTWRDSIVGNEGGVLVFAQRLNNYYSPSLEMALWNAWNKACMTVVCSAGNTFLDTTPRTPTASMPAVDTPSGIEYATTPSRIPSTWSGFFASNQWAHITSGSYVPGNDYLIIAGASGTDGLRWLGPSSTGSNRGSGVDVWAPGADLPLASSVTASTVGRSGTSFSAGYTAGLAAYYLSHRPFATGPTVKKWIQTTSNNLSSIVSGIGTLPGPVTKPRLIVTSTTPPTICSQYTDWRADCSLVPSIVPPTVGFDTDGDLVLNGIEFAVGTHPRISDSILHAACDYFDPSSGAMVAQPAYPPLPAFDIWVAPHTIQTYKSYLMNWPLVGVTCHWEFSPDLLTWTPAPLTLFAMPVRAEGYMYQGSTPLAWSSGFFRIRTTTD